MKLALGALSTADPDDIRESWERGQDWRVKNGEVFDISPGQAPISIYVPPPLDHPMYRESVAMTEAVIGHSSTWGYSLYAR